MSYGSVIAAISTPSGKGGVAVIRMSGAGCIDIFDTIFFPKSKKRFKDCPARMQTYGDLISNGEYIDDVMATLFRAPNSYTGEDTVEVSCHGGVLVTKRVLEALFSAGAAPALGGEFTERAFINGKLSLTEAEAIANLLDARTNEQAKLYSAAARSLLTIKIDEIRASLTELLSSIFARIDYPDEDLGDFTSDETVDRLKEIRHSLTSLISTYPTGKAINEGINTVICGKTNVGKSTLYNALVGEDAAIVTDIEGTTRDVLSRSVALGKLLLNLSDTAGVRNEALADTVEKIGIERTRAAIGTAELIIAVFDGSREADGEDTELVLLLSEISAPKIAVVNKSDLERKLDTALIYEKFDVVIETSARVSALDAAAALKVPIEKLFTDEKISTDKDAIVSSARQNASLTKALGFVNAAIAAEESGVYADAAASEIERALGAIAETDGRAVSEEVVSEIFSRFCVGK